MIMTIPAAINNQSMKNRLTRLRKKLENKKQHTKSCDKTATLTTYTRQIHGNTMQIQCKTDNEGHSYSYEVPRIQFVQEYFEGAPAIDVHNHIRQAGLALEQVWNT
jgi:hypothetical protein